MTDQSIKVTILMATYNGERYLNEQLNSIISQEYQNWELIIRDDKSSDRTLQIINEYVALDTRISQIFYGNVYGSACSNFSQLCNWAAVNKKNYIMFSDQDDIWLPQKIAASLNILVAYERDYGSEVPLLCYSNLKFIDSLGKPISTQLALPSKLKLGVMLNENYAWGCTMILNSAALNLAVPIPTEAVNHDYYIALVVSAIGNAHLIDQYLILYRQHTNNVSGSVDNLKISSRVNRYIKNTEYMLKPLTQNLQLVDYVYNRFKNALSYDQREMMHQFLNGYYAGFIRLIYVMLKYRILKIGFGKNLVYIYTLLLLRKKVLKNLSKIRIYAN